MATPTKTCFSCKKKVHVRRKNCDCGYRFISEREIMAMLEEEDEAMQREEAEKSLIASGMDPDEICDMDIEREMEEQRNNMTAWIDQLPF